MAGTDLNGKPEGLAFTPQGSRVSSASTRASRAEIFVC
jgi:hypothetical protein